jgi:hypothetical protein
LRAALLLRCRIPAGFSFEAALKQKGFSVVPTIELRRARTYASATLLLALTATPLAAATHTLAADGDLQAALNAAQPGDVIQLAPGATYTGNFKLPVKNGDAYIVVRTGGPARDLPPAGTRVSPEHAPALAKIKSPNTTAALSTTPGAHHWRIELIEFPATVNGSGDIIVFGGSASQTQVAQMPHSLIVDRVYVHGDPVVGQKRGIALNSGATQVINSYISEIKAVGQDSQAIGGWNGSGPYLIENNYLEGAGENVMFGGSDPSIPNLVPSDITIRRNYFTKPLEWRGQKWQVKNAFELKNARRVLVEGNVFENVWVAAQAGYAILLSTRNQDGKAPWSVVEDVTFRYNVIRHVANAINISGYDDTHPSAQGKRFRISHNLVYDVDGAAWGGKGTFLQVGNEARDVVVEHNTVEHGGNAVTVYGKRDGALAVIDGFVFRDNLMRHNSYGVKGDGLGVGSATLSAYFANVTFERNALAGGKASQYPAGNYFPTSDEFAAAFVNAAEGNFALVPGSQFRGAASDGSALGADLVRLNSAAAGPVSSAPGTPQAGTPNAGAPQTGTPAAPPQASDIDEPWFHPIW